MLRRRFCQASLVAGGALALSPWLRAAGAEVHATTIAGKELSLPASAVDDLAAGLRGPLLLPGNAAYDEARQVLNPTIDKHPALIVQPSGVADVMRAVQFAQDHRLSTAIKCGGHSASGKSTVNGGLQIDLSRFRHVRVDPAQRVAYVSGGSLLGAMDHEALAHGLVTTAGTVSHTGVGGLATGGGFGRLGRKYGLTLDNIKAVEVVSADGQVRRASADEYADLYWGVRGGGSNFGVVTGFEFQLHPMDRHVLLGNFVYPYARLKDALAFYAEFGPRAPDELQVDLVFGFPPGNDQGFVFFQNVWCGREADGRKLLEQYASLGKPIQQTLAMTDYEVIQRSSDWDAPRSTATYLKGGFLSELTPALIDDIAAGLEPGAGRSAQMIFQQAGGAIGRVPADATAFPHRYAEFNMMTTIGWKPDQPADPHKQWIKSYWSKLAPYTHGFYSVEADDDNASQWDRNYQGNYARLVEVKRRYDPDNIFRLNANVSPA
ncbi:MAG: FAD-binding oxidoreductase [Halieaceae bacterium]|jgi:FAD/FMN-containing dehydrogenase|nr:FAD-binding oxidoreductase [Halieaceae bacterium]